MHRGASTLFSLANEKEGKSFHADNSIALPATFMLTSIIIIMKTL